MNYLKLIYSLLALLLAQTISWFQLYGHTKFDWLKDNPWFAYLLSIPVTMLYIKAVGWTMEIFEGSMWPSRFMSFTMGIIIFTILAIFLNNEAITLKTGVCIVLSFAIILIQIYA